MRGSKGARGPILGSMLTVALVTVALVVPALGSPERQVIELEIGSSGGTFESGDVVQGFSRSGCRATGQLDGPLVDVEASGGYLGLRYGKLGVEKDGGSGSCFKVDRSGEVLSFEGPEGTTQSFDEVVLRLRVTADTRITATLTGSAGTSQALLKVGDDDDEGPSSALSTAAAPTGYCGGDDDATTCEWTIRGFGLFQSIALERTHGTFSVIGDARKPTLFYVANTAPTADDDSATVAEGGSVDIDVKDGDSDAEDAGGVPAGAVTIVSSPSNGSATANADGTVTYQHDGSETLSDSLTYQVADGFGELSNVATVSISVTPVNDAPVADPDSATVAEGGSVDVTVKDGDSDAEDAGGVPGGAVTVVGSAVNGTATANDDGTITYVHDGSETLSGSFEYTVADSDGASSDKATVSIDVTPVNDPPVADDDAITVSEDAFEGAGGEGADDVTADLLDGDTDVDGGPLQITEIGGGTSLTVDGVTIAISGGVVTVDTNGAFESLGASDELVLPAFDYTVDDGNGGTGIGAVTITIDGQNDEPVAPGDTPGSITIVTDEGQTSEPQPIASDPDDGEVPSLEYCQDPTQAPISGGARDGQVEIRSQGETVGYVIPSVEEGVLVVQFEPVDDDVNTGDGSLVFNCFVGDGGDATTTVTISVDLTVSPVNDAPVANDDLLATDENGDLTGANVLDNDEDVDGDALSIESAALDGAPLPLGVATPVGDAGTLTVNADGSIAYDASDLLEVVSFTYVASDGALVSDEATVTIAVPLECEEDYTFGGGDLEPTYQIRIEYPTGLPDGTICPRKLALFDFGTEEDVGGVEVADQFVELVPLGQVGEGDRGQQALLEVVEFLPEPLSNGDNQAAQFPFTLFYSDTLIPGTLDFGPEVEAQLCDEDPRAIVGGQRVFDLDQTFVNDPGLVLPAGETTCIVEAQFTIAGTDGTTGDPLLKAVYVLFNLGDGRRTFR